MITVLQVWTRNLRKGSSFTEKFAYRVWPSGRNCWVPSQNREGKLCCPHLISSLLPLALCSSATFRDQFDPPGASVLDRGKMLRESVFYLSVHMRELSSEFVQHWSVPSWHHSTQSLLQLKGREADFIWGRNAHPVIWSIIMFTLYKRRLKRGGGKRYIQMFKIWSYVKKESMWL